MLSRSLLRPQLIFGLYILSISLLLGMPDTLIAAGELALTFHRAIEDKAATNSKHLSRYNRLIIKHSNVDIKYYYVEAQAAHVTPQAAIESVKVSSKKYGNEVGEKRNRAPDVVFYTLTFKITPIEAKRFSAFINKNKDGGFQVKIGERSLGVTQFYWPFEVKEGEGLEFTIMLREDNANNIEKSLAPLKDKIVRD